MQLENLFHLNVIVPWLAAMVFGVFVGSTPGLTATMAVALIVPISYYMSPEAGIAMVIGVSFTAIFAGDIPATYLRIPGTPASAAATLDGHEFAKRGRLSLLLLPPGTLRFFEFASSCLDNWESSFLWVWLGFGGRGRSRRGYIRRW